MGPCTAPTFSASAAKPACGCAHATETQPVSVVHASRAFALDPIRVSRFDEEARVPSGLVVLLAAVAVLAWMRQRRGAGLTPLHLARPETPPERRRLRRPRLVLSDRERRGLAAVHSIFERAPRPALVALRAPVPRRAPGR